MHLQKGCNHLRFCHSFIHSFPFHVKRFLSSPNPVFKMEEYLQLFKNETDFYNRIVLGSLLPQNLWKSLPHICRTWLRNKVGRVFIYLITGLLWCFHIYHLRRNVCVRGDARPSMKTMVLHIGVTMESMPWFAALPNFSGSAVEKGWTKCLSRTSEVGWLAFCLYLVEYIAVVEFLTYWIHRKLHAIKPLYKNLHAPHHSYNKQHKISPLACLAIHPLDGTAQRAPQAMAILMVPTHFTTHLALIFFGVIWSANVHDCIDEKLWPLMVGGYHLIHHLTYRHNYGLYTVWMDWMFGTLCHPVSNSTLVG